MQTYYEILAEHHGTTEIMHGSFDKADCDYELEAEREGWKGEGYCRIRIVARETTHEADSDVYETVSSSDVFHRYAPNFNFELSEIELVETGLARGFLTRVGTNKYLINQDY